MHTDAAEPRGAPDRAADRGRVRAAAVGAGDGAVAVTTNEVKKKKRYNQRCPEF